jgi:hypothetical protein
MYLNGDFLDNNSIVLLSDVGEGGGALYCLTDSESCCGNETGGADRGLWQFPNGSNVMGENTTADIYFTRGFSSLLLNRRSSTVRSTGVYTCLIPDAGGALRNYNARVYSELKGNCKTS